MAVYLGSTKIKEFYLGASKIKQAYLGASPLFVSALPVTYYVDTGESYVENVEPGNTVLSPTSFTPTKSGYTFVGWREDTVASSSVIASKVMADSPITLYAVFNKSITLTTYNLSTSATTASDYQYYNYGNVLSPTFNLIQSDASGWTKVGWTTDLSSHVAEKNPTDTVTLSANATYHTIYSATITLTKYNASNTASTETGTRWCTNGPANTVVDPTFTLTQGALSGWTKAGWTTNASGYSATVADGGTVTLSANATYYSLYTAAVTVTKYTNGAGATATETKNRIANVHSTTTFQNPSFTLTEPDLSGWTKYGWADAADFTADVANGGSVTLTANKTYYALYYVNVTVTYYNNSSTASTSTKARYVRAGTSWTFSNPTFNLTVTAVSGWTVRGWSTSSAANGTISYNSATNFTRDSSVTLYASWTANVTVTYYNNSSTASTSTQAMYRGYKGDVTGATFNLSEASVSGWTARGWSTSSAANASITYNNATNFTRTSACTLYASWSKTVTVSYNGNSNTGGSTSASTGTAYRGYKGDVTNASISLRANGFSRTNYTFYRWALNSASGTQYKAGASISLNANATMYAYWLATTVNFGYTGGVQTFAAKAGVTYQLKVWGAQGNATVTHQSHTAVGGAGGYAVGNKAVTANTTWYVVVGGQGKSGTTSTIEGGYNGGGTLSNLHSGDTAGSAGGATHIGLSNAVLASTATANVLIVAGGGGAAFAYGATNATGGTGGGTSGGTGTGWQSRCGAGGTQTSGAAYGAGQNNTDGYAPGGGGFYGGYKELAAGGGGSGYTGGVTSGSMSNGQRTGSGYATIVISSVS